MRLLFRESVVEVPVRPFSYFVSEMLSLYHYTVVAQTHLSSQYDEDVGPSVVTVVDHSVLLYVLVFA